MAYLSLFCQKISTNSRKKSQPWGGVSSRLGQIPNFYRKFVPDLGKIPTFSQFFFGNVPYTECKLFSVYQWKKTFSAMPERKRFFSLMSSLSWDILVFFVWYLLYWSFCILSFGHGQRSNSSISVVSDTKSLRSATLQPLAVSILQRQESTNGSVAQTEVGLPGPWPELKDHRGPSCQCCNQSEERRTLDKGWTSSHIIATWSKSPQNSIQSVVIRPLNH